MITIFTTPLDTKDFKITHMRVDETTLMPSLLTKGMMYGSNIGEEGIWWHRNLGKAKECMRKRKAEWIRSLKAQILEVKRMPIIVSRL